MLKTAQPEFDLQLPAGRPLIPIEAVMVLADRDEDDVLNLIDIGMLRWAFDIATPGTDRRELRIFRESLIDYLRGDTAAMGRKNQTETVEGIIARILPRPSIVNGYGTIRGTELQRRFSCCQGHVNNLIKTGELSLAPIVTPQKVSPFVLHFSAAAFLRSRELKGKA